MNIEYDPQADAVYVNLTTKQYAYGKDLDNERRIDYASDGTPVGIELLCVSKGVNVSGLPYVEQIRELLEARGIKTYIMEDRSQIETSSPNTSVLFVAWVKEENTRIIEPVEVRPMISFKFNKPSKRAPKNKVVFQEEAVTK